MVSNHASCLAVCPSLRVLLYCVVLFGPYPLLHGFIVGMCPACSPPLLISLIIRYAYQVLCCHQAWVLPPNVLQCAFVVCCQQASVSRLLFSNVLTVLYYAVIRHEFRPLLLSNVCNVLSSGMGFAPFCSPMC